MWIDAPLADKAQVWKPLNQRGPDLGPLADQDECFCVLQSVGEQIVGLHVIGPDGHVMSVQFLETRQRPERIEIVVEDGDIHEEHPARNHFTCLTRSASLRAYTWSGWPVLTDHRAEGAAGA